MNVIGYMRTSSQTNVGGDKDSGKRQQRAIKSFCKSKKYKLAETFYDENVSGSNALRDRPQLLSAINYCNENSINIIVVENSDRFSRSLLQQEVMLMTLQTKGIKVICCNNDKFSSASESDVMFRQIGGAFNQYQKDLLVSRLRDSRNNKRKENKKLRQRKYTTLDGGGKCEGAPQHYMNEKDGKLVREIKKMYQRKTHSLRQIAMHMFWKYEMVNKNGMVLSAAQVKRIVEYKPLREK
jgi:DNA invertase Pin-like site-specific DNA recombinase